jgi:CubicO group peptidase (beta-lactamase class C family)
MRRSMLALFLVLFLVPLFACVAADVPGDTPAGGHGVVPDAADTVARGAAQGAAVRTRGLDAARLDGIYAQAAGLPRLYSLLVARHGELVREAYYNGHNADGYTNIKSASKSVVAALVGLAVADGYLQGLHQPIAPFFDDYLTDQADPRIREVTVEHLLSMQAGMQPTSFGGYGAWVSSGNWVRHVLTRPFTDEPGGAMLYSTGSTHLLSAILTRATGRSTLAWARERLAGPLGVTLPAWTTDPQGIYMGGNEMSMRPRDLLAFGELYRNGGVGPAGERILPEWWIVESWRPRTSSRFNSHRYGLGWWVRNSGAHAVYFAWGYGGQYTFVVPSLELTVVMTSDPISPREGSHNRTLHRLLDEIVAAAEVGVAAATS